MSSKVKTQPRKKPRNTTVLQMILHCKAYRAPTAAPYNRRDNRKVIKDHND